MNSRFIEINKDNTTIELKIKQDSKYGYAGEVWDAALVFTHFLSSKQTAFDFNDKNIIELGAGTGICGITLAANYQPRKIVITELAANLDLIKLSIDTNTNFLNSDIIVEDLDWNNSNKFGNEQFDYIIGSDLIYKEELFEPLQKLIDRLLIVNGIMLLSYTHRKESDFKFFDYFRNNNVKWKMETLPNDLLDENYRSEDIFVIILKKIAN